MAAGFVHRFLVLGLSATVAAGQAGFFWSLAGIEGETDVRRLADNNTAPAPTQEPFKVTDDVEAANCVLGKNCSDGGMDPLRGLCVLSTSPGGKACWDVCNPKHSPQQYKVNNNAAVTMSYAGMVESVRAGLNPMVSCPNLEGGDPCPPGDFCPAAMLAEFKILKGRGMCVIDPNQHTSRSCWDMCNFHRSVSEFTMGTPEGTGATVSATRASGICPGTPWWFYPVVGLSILAIIGCCAGLFVAVKHVGARRLRSRKESLVESRYNEEQRDYKEYGEPMHEDLAGGMSQPRESAAPPPAAHEYMMQQPQEQIYAQPPQTPASPQAQEPLAGLYDGGASRQVQTGPPPQGMQQQFSPMGMSTPNTVPGGVGLLSPQGLDNTHLTGGSMRIPGLDEPNLLNSMPSLQVGGSEHYHQQQYRLGTTQPATQVLQNSFQGQPVGTVGMPSFHTQVPMNYMAGASPPGSIQMQPGVQPGFFTTLQRR